MPSPPCVEALCETNIFSSFSRSLYDYVQRGRKLITVAILRNTRFNVQELDVFTTEFICML